MLDFFVELGVLNGDGGLPGQCEQQIDFLPGKLVRCLGVKSQDADDFVLGDQRDAEIADKAVLSVKK